MHESQTALRHSGVLFVFCPLSTFFDLILHLFSSVVKKMQAKEKNREWYFFRFFKKEEKPLVIEAKKQYNIG